MIKKSYVRLFSLMSLCLLISCTSVHNRTFTAEHLIQSKQWQPRLIQTSSFTLMSYGPTFKSKNVLTVYIEGDGLAWINKHRPSSNPTPINPLALKLALNDPTDNAVYLARPCQYTRGAEFTGCEIKYWTSHRFSAEIINATSEAIDNLKQQYSSTKIILIGYSGGAAIASLLATQRSDVVKIISIAGNLNHQAWTDFHNIDHLSGSLNPFTYIDKLTSIEQIHFVGEGDLIVPPFLTMDYVASYPLNSNIKIITMPDSTHGCCWHQQWEKLYKTLTYR